MFIRPIKENEDRNDAYMAQYIATHGIDSVRQVTCAHCGRSIYVKKTDRRWKSRRGWVTVGANDVLCALCSRYFLSKKRYTAQPVKEDDRQNSCVQSNAVGV